MTKKNALSFAALFVFFQLCLGAAGVYFVSQKVENNRCPSSINEEKFLIGHTEKIFLGDHKEMAFEAKVDSGAEVSSIHALRIHPFTQMIKENGKNKEILFVRFTTSDDAGKARTIERMVSRVDQVKSASGVSSRYFFHETLWIAGKDYEVEINLADRTQLSKKFLIGKNILSKGYLIDTSRSYLLTAKPQ